VRDPCDVRRGAATAISTTRVSPLRSVVVDEQAAALHEVRVDREAEEPLLAPAGDARGQIEERGVEEPASLQDTDAPRLLDDEQAPRGIPRGERHRERLVELLGDARERDLRRRLRRNRNGDRHPREESCG
jgi:hypothetical protein